MGNTTTKIKIERRECGVRENPIDLGHLFKFIYFVNERERRELSE